MSKYRRSDRPVRFAPIGPALREIRQQSSPCDHRGIGLCLGLRALRMSAADMFQQDAPTLTPAVLREIAEEAGVVTSASGSSERYNAHLVVGAIDRGEPAPSVSRVVRERVVAALAARRALLAPEPAEPTAAELEAAGQATLFGGGQ